MCIKLNNMKYLGYEEPSEWGGRLTKEGYDLECSRVLLNNPYTCSKNFRK